MTKFSFSPVIPVVRSLTLAKNDNMIFCEVLLFQNKNSVLFEEIFRTLPHEIICAAALW
jgi:hypothetical protein